MNERVAGIDVGTTRVKLRIYDPGNNWRLTYKQDIETPIVERGLHDPGKLIKIIEILVKTAREKGAKTIGLSSYRGSLLAWNEKTREALTPVYTWMDTSPWKHLDKTPLKAKIASRIPKLKTLLQPETLAFRLWSLSREKPEILEKLRDGGILAWNIDAYILHKLNGEPLTDPTIAALTGLVHPSTLSIIKIGLRLLDLPTIPLPRIALNHECLPGPVNASMGDQQAGLHGSECLKPGCVKVTLGTGGFIDAPVGERLILSPGYGLVPLIIEYSRFRVAYGVEAIMPGLGESVRRIIEGILDGDYKYIDGDSWGIVEPARVNLAAWGVRWPRQSPSGIIEVGFNVDFINKAGLGLGVVNAVVDLVYYHYRIVEELVRGRVGVGLERIVLTGGLTRSQQITGRLKDKIGKTMSVRGDVEALGAAKLAYRNCIEN